jgi:release factor glutamine methyltransferase
MSAAAIAPMLTVLEVIKKTTDYFASKGLENARLNAEHLIGHALNLKRMQLYLQFERPLSEGELEKIRPLVRRRAQREPLQYIVGETDWFGLRLKVDRRALIPRPETERLLELVIERISAPPARCLDLGTGTGALALALANRFPDTRVTAVDASEAALALARENAVALNLIERVDFVPSNWFTAVPPDARFGLIVANPPYLTEAEVAEAEPEVKDFEPASALIAPEDGLADLRVIVAGSVGALEQGGLLALETGVAQHAALLQACSEAGYSRSESKQDLTGRDRFVFAWR